MPLMWEKKKIAGIPNLVKTLKDTTYEDTEDNYRILPEIIQSAHRILSATN
jgi:hypothetical protein